MSLAVDVRPRHDWVTAAGCCGLRRVEPGPPRREWKILAG